jgi:hypothetical protein
VGMYVRAATATPNLLHLSPLPMPNPLSTIPVNGQVRGSLGVHQLAILVCLTLIGRPLLSIYIYSLCSFLLCILDLVKVKLDKVWLNILLNKYSLIISNTYNIKVFFMMILTISILYCKCLYFSCTI